MNDFLSDNIQGDLMGAPGGRSRSKGSRGEFEKHFREVPHHIKSELSNARLRLGDNVIYSVKPVSGSKTIKLFETQDDKRLGLRAISNAKLPKNQALLVSGVYLMAGIAPAANPGNPTEEEIMATPFAPISSNPDFASLVSGEFNLKANKVTLIPEISMRVFADTISVMWPDGFYKLHNTRMIQDDVLIEATIELGSMVNIPQDTYIYCGLYGTITTP